MEQTSGAMYTDCNNALAPWYTECNNAAAPYYTQCTWSHRFVPVVLVNKVGGNMT